MVNQKNQSEQIFSPRRNSWNAGTPSSSEIAEQRNRGSINSLRKTTCSLNLFEDRYLTLYEAERYCTLDLSNNQQAIITQRHYAKFLSEYYKKGGVETPADQWKAKTYELLTNNSYSRELILKKINELNKINFKRNRSWYSALSWFTSLRLFTIRALRVITYFTGPLKTRLLAIGGFSYGIELILDIGVLIKHIIKPDEGEKHIPWYSRLYNSFEKDNRWYRILNAAVWLSVNVAAFVLTGGISAILNICGFTFDPINEFILSWLEIKKNKQLAEKLQKKLSYLDNSLIEHDKDDFLAYKKLINEKTSFEESLKALNLKIKENKKSKDETRNYEYELLKSEDESTKQDLEKKITHHTNLIKTAIHNMQIKNNSNLDFIGEYIKTELEISKLNNTINNLVKDRIHTVFVVLAVLAGMALILFPPAGISSLAAALIVLLAGSVLGGLGKRLYKQSDDIKQFFSNGWDRIKNCFSSNKVIEDKPLLKKTSIKNGSAFTLTIHAAQAVKKVFDTQSRFPRIKSLPNLTSRFSSLPLSLTLVPVDSPSLDAIHEDDEKLTRQAPLSERGRKKTSVQEAREVEMIKIIPQASRRSLPDIKIAKQAKKHPLSDLSLFAQSQVQTDPLKDPSKKETFHSALAPNRPLDSLSS